MKKEKSFRLPALRVEKISLPSIHSAYIYTAKNELAMHWHHVSLKTTRLDAVLCHKK